MEKADDALKVADLTGKNDLPKESAFNFHRVVEKLFNCTELVFIAYQPPSHNVLELKTRCQKFIPALKNFFFDEKQKCFCNKKKHQLFLNLKKVWRIFVQIVIHPLLYSSNLPKLTYNNLL